MKEVKIDFRIEGGGSLYLLHPQSDQAKTWIAENIGQNNGYQPYYPSIAIESRYLNDIVEGITADGMTLI